MKFENLFNSNKDQKAEKVASEEQLRLERESSEYYQKLSEVFSKEALINIIGSELHDKWRASRKKEDGNFEPRIKTTKDTEWIGKKGTDQVDIANTSYRELPEDWKAENKSSAEVIYGYIKKNQESGIIFDNEFIEQASSIIHEKWLERNGEWAEAEQKKPYDDLSEEEKEKDRVIAREGVKKFEEMTYLRKAINIAEQIIGIIHSNKKEYTQEAVSVTGFNLDDEKINKLISDKAGEADIPEEYIKRCLSSYSAGTNSDYANAYLAIKDPYTRKNLWGDNYKQQHAPVK